MNRRQRLREKAMDRLHRSRLGHAGFDEVPDLCRHCCEDFDVRKAR